MSECGRNDFFLFWIKQKKQNKDLLASKGKVAGKQITL